MLIGNLLILQHLQEKMMMQMVGVCAEFERGMLKERTLKGLQYAREQGRIGVLNRN